MDGPLDPCPTETAPQSPLDAPRLPQRAASFLAGGVGGKAKQQAGGRQPPHFFNQGDDQHRPKQNNGLYTCTEFLLGGSNGASARCPMWQRKPTGGRALKGVTTAVSPSVLALRSEQGRDSFRRIATQPEKGRTTSSSARPKPGEGGQRGALLTSTQHGTPPSTQQQLAPMLRWSGDWRNEVGGQRR